MENTDNTVAPTTVQDVPTSNENTGKETSEAMENTFVKEPQKKRAIFGKDTAHHALQEAKLAEHTKNLENIGLDDMQELNLPQGDSKGINYKEVISSLPEDAQKLLGNLRADYTRKTQDLAKQRKAIEAQRKALSESNFMKQTRELAQKDDVDLDPYNIKSFEARIEQEVARRMDQMMQPIREQQHLEIRKMKLQQFKSDHPDLESYKHDVAKVLTANTNLSLEDAYYIVKGKKGITETERLRQESLTDRQNRRENGLKVGKPSTHSARRPPKGLKGHQIYDWFKTHGQK